MQLIHNTKLIIVCKKARKVMTRNTGFISRGFRCAGVLAALLLVTGALRCTGVTLGSLDPDDGEGNGEADMAYQPPPKTVGLRIVPDNDVLLVDVNQTQDKAFKVFAHYSDGTAVEVTASVTLSLDNSNVGSLSGTTFTSAKSATAQVGFSKVLASYTDNGQTASGYANLTVVWLRQTGTATDFFFQLPYMGGPQDQPLQFGTNVQSLDSFFAVDTTGSMGPSIIALRDSLYMASVTAGGWPYMQHRGGPRGFLRVLDERTLGFADVRGNRQYVSVGNLGQDDRVAMILVDYPAQARLKLLARARLVERADDPALAERLTPPEFVGKVERSVVLTVEGFDWNCPQHITPRFTEAEIAQAVAPLHEEIERLKRELAEIQHAAG